MNLRKRNSKKMSNIFSFSAHQNFIKIKLFVAFVINNVNKYKLVKF